MRKIGFVGAALVAMSFALTACGGSDGGDSSAKAKAAPSMSASKPMAQAADKRGCSPGSTARR